MSLPDREEGREKERERRLDSASEWHIVVSWHNTVQYNIVDLHIVAVICMECHPKSRGCCCCCC